MAKIRGLVDRIIATQRMDMSRTASRSALGQVKELWGVAQDARETAQWLQSWHDLTMRNPRDLPLLPANATVDDRRLRELSKTPWGRTIVRTTAQGLVIDGFRLKDDRAESPAQRVWQQNALDARQQPLVHGMLTHGYAYNVILPAVGRLDGKPTALIRGKSALRMTAFYRDDFDEYPEFAIEVDTIVTNDKEELFVTFYDDTHVHRMSCSKGDGSDMTYIDNFAHGMGVTPIVRYADIDLEGNAVGEIEPYIPIFRRLDQGTCDRLIVQRKGAFVTRTATGIKPGSTDEESDEIALQLEVGDLLVSDEPTSRFGHIPATPLDGYVQTHDVDLKELGATSQTPEYRLTGLGDNLGAEGIAAATEALEAKRRSYKRIVGEAHEMSMRLAGHAMGDEAIASDYESRSHWVVEPKGSLQSLAQALGTMVRMTGMPPEMTWDMWPEWTREDTLRALDQIEAEKARQALLAAMGGENGNDGAAGPGEAGDNAPAAADGAS